MDIHERANKSIIDHSLGWFHSSTPEPADTIALKGNIRLQKPRSNCSSNNYSNLRIDSECILKNFRGDSNSRRLQNTTSKMHVLDSMSPEFVSILRLQQFAVCPIDQTVGHCIHSICKHDDCHESSDGCFAGCHRHVRRHARGSSPISAGGGAKIPRPNYGGKATVVFYNLRQS